MNWSKMTRNNKSTKAENFGVANNKVTCTWSYETNKGAGVVDFAANYKDQIVVDYIKNSRIKPQDILVSGKLNGKPLFLIFDEPIYQEEFRAFCSENSMEEYLNNSDATINKAQAFLDSKKKEAEEKLAQMNKLHEERKARDLEIQTKTAIRVLHINTAHEYETSIYIRWCYRDEEGVLGYASEIPGIIDLTNRNPVIGEIVKQEPEAENWANRFYAITPEQEAALVEAQDILNKETEAKKIKIAEIKKAEKIAAEQKKEADLRDAMENELFIFSPAYLSSTNFKLLHSVGAVQTRNGTIEIYLTRDSKALEAKFTAEMEKEVRDMGAHKNASGFWEMPMSEENWENTIIFLKKHDKKGNPVEMGYRQCWECGVWYRGPRCGCEE